MSARTLGELAARALQLCKDADAGLNSPNDEEAAVNSAVSALSKWRPLVRVHKYTGDGATYNLAAPAFWVVGFSRVLEIRTPWTDASQSPRSPLTEEEFFVYLDSDGVEKIKLLRVIPATGETCRVLYTVPHVVNSTSSTIANAEHEEAVIGFAASLLLQQMASYCNALANTSLGADSKDHAARAEKYSNLAGYYLKRSGLEDGLSAHAVTMPRTDTGGNRRLTHK